MTAIRKPWITATSVAFALIVGAFVVVGYITDWKWSQDGTTNIQLANSNLHDPPNNWPTQVFAKFVDVNTDAVYVIRGWDLFSVDPISGANKRLASLKDVLQSEESIVGTQIFSQGNSLAVKTLSSRGPGRLVVADLRVPSKSVTLSSEFINQFATSYKCRFVVWSSRHKDGCRIGLANLLDSKHSSINLTRSSDLYYVSVSEDGESVFASFSNGKIEILDKTLETIGSATLPAPADFVDRFGSDRKLIALTRPSFGVREGSVRCVDVKTNAVCWEIPLSDDHTVVDVSRERRKLVLESADADNSGLVAWSIKAVDLDIGSMSSMNVDCKGEPAAWWSRSLNRLMMVCVPR